MSMVQGAVYVNHTLMPIVAKGCVDVVIVWPHLGEVPPKSIE